MFNLAALVPGSSSRRSSPFTIRDLAQFGAIAVSLVGAFITARIQIKQLIERMQVHEDLFKTVDNRLDNAESARAVIDSRVHVLSEISSVSSIIKLIIFLLPEQKTKL